MMNVMRVLEKKMCTGCGICESICPTKAIEIVYNENFGHFIPKIDNEKCTECGVCLQSCSGGGIDHLALQKNKFGKLPENPILGHIEKVYISYSLQKKLQENGASGGSVTVILTNLFNQKKIEAAVIANTTVTTVSENRAVVVTSAKELNENQSSNYTNVPMLKDLGNILQKYNHIALVALPCQIHALQKAIAFKPEWNNKIVLTIGLICGGVYSNNAVKRHIQSINLPRKEISSISFRQGKLPGRMVIKTKTDKMIKSRRGQFFITNYLRRCFFCNDLLNELADVSVGDNWLKDRGNGENIIIIRNKKALSYLQNLHKTEIDSNKLYSAYRIDSRRRKYFKANKLVAKLWGWPIPKIQTDPRIKAKFKHYFISFLDSVQFQMGNASSKHIRRFLKMKNIIDHFIIKNSILKLLRWKPEMNENKQLTILISESDVVGNKGAVAMLNLLMKLLQEQFGDVNFIVTSMHRNNHPTNDEIEVLNTNGQAFDIALVKLWIWWLFSQIGIKFNFLLNDKILKHYLAADIVISASGISFNEDFGFINLYHFSKFIQIPLLLGKKVVKFTQTIGPFNSLYNKRLGRLTLNNVDKIIARGKLSESHLRRIGIEKNVVTLPDIALTLKSKESTRTKELILKLSGKTIIGISPNIVCQRLDKKKKYVPALINLCDRILQKYPNAELLLLPHTIVAETAGTDDDLSICLNIKRLAKKSDRIFVDNTVDYSPAEAKWLISECDFFIGSRFHSVIAAVSSFVPPITIGWHWKYRESMEWLHLENNLIQYWELDQEKLWDLFKKNFERRDEIKLKLKREIPILQRKALQAISVISEVLK